MSVILEVIWKNFLVLKVFLQCDASSHDSCELDVVYDICTGVGCEVFFDCLFANPSNTSDKASDCCGIENRFHELVVRHCVYIKFLKSIILAFILTLIFTIIFVLLNRLSSDFFIVLLNCIGNCLYKEEVCTKPRKN